MNKLSRRTVLKSIGLVGLGGATVAMRGLPSLRTPTAVPSLQPHWQGQPLGRITGAWMNARSEPTTDSDVVSQLVQDDLIRVRRVVRGQTVFAYNDLWLETSLGYFYSSFVQPMWYHLPNPPQPISGEGRWAELTVPYSDAYYVADPSLEDRFVSRMYYGTTYRVKKLIEGADGKSWYEIQELYQTYYLRATHLRLIPDEDLLPLSPEVDPRDKWLDVNLSQQIVTAYEKDQPVWAHRIATGLPDWATPEGRFYIHDKRISTRMIGGRAADEETTDHYNLAGVPFVCYFTYDWVATHGTFWHNDYGQPHSHGCVNLPPDAARFVWRWSTPHGELSDLFVRPSNRLEGTRVEVHY